MRKYIRVKTTGGEFITAEIVDSCDETLTPVFIDPRFGEENCEKYDYYSDGVNIVAILFVKNA